MTNLDQSNTQLFAETNGRVDSTCCIQCNSKQNPYRTKKTSKCQSAYQSAYHPISSDTRMDKSINVMFCNTSSEWTKSVQQLSNNFWLHTHWM